MVEGVVEQENHFQDSVWNWHALDDALKRLLISWTIRWISMVMEQCAPGQLVAFAGWEYPSPQGNQKNVYCTDITQSPKAD